MGVQLSEQILHLALTHRSYAHENGGLPTNERLEFLGDAVLGVIIAEELFRRFPDALEGDLHKRRASVVSAVSLAEIARELGLGEYLLLGRGEAQSGGQDKSNILADALEALIGACFLEHGFEATRLVVLRLTSAQLAKAEIAGEHYDPKTTLQEVAARGGHEAPRYEVTESGSDHQKTFTARVAVGPVLGQGSGSSKKSAEIAAARNALDQIGS